MSLFTGAQSNSSSIGGSTQSIIFNPILNARGASSGTVSNEGIAPTNTNTLTNSLGGAPDAAASDSEGLISSLGLDSTRATLPRNNYLSPASFSSDALPSGRLPGQPDGAAAPAPSLLLPMVALVAVVGLVLFVGR